MLFSHALQYIPILCWGEILTHFLTYSIGILHSKMLHSLMNNFLFIFSSFLLNFALDKQQQFLHAHKRPVYVTSLLRLFMFYLLLLLVILINLTRLLFLLIMVTNAHQSQSSIFLKYSQFIHYLIAAPNHCAKKLYL